jgi:hypothetical protein
MGSCNSEVVSLDLNGRQDRSDVVLSSASGATIGEFDACEVSPYVKSHHKGVGRGQSA